MTLELRSLQKTAGLEISEHCNFIEMNDGMSFKLNGLFLEGQIRTLFFSCSCFLRMALNGSR